MYIGCIFESHRDKSIICLFALGSLWEMAQKYTVNAFSRLWFVFYLVSTLFFCGTICVWLVERFVTLLCHLVPSIQQHLIQLSVCGLHYCKTTSSLLQDRTSPCGLGSLMCPIYIVGHSIDSFFFGLPIHLLPFPLCIHSSGAAVGRWQSFDVPFILPPALRPRHGPVCYCPLTLGLVLYVYRA